LLERGAVGSLTLYHYTCTHGAKFIRRDRLVIKPSWQPLLGVHGVWATDMDTPDADCLGLTSNLLSCNRTEHRFAVLEPERFVTWREFLVGFRVDPRIISELTKPPLQPGRWWISALPANVEPS
jgi:hypothetical protein